MEKDLRVQRFLELWSAQHFSVTPKQKEQVGMAYMVEVLGVSEKVALQFADGNEEAYHIVGMEQSAIPSDTDTSGFWKRMSEIFPGVYSPEDLEYLNGQGGVPAVLSMLFHLNPPFKGTSPLLISLANNAQIYK